MSKQNTLTPRLRAGVSVKSRSADYLRAQTETIFLPKLTATSDTPAPVPGRDLRLGFVGTFPPTKCGIATFTASLSKAMAGNGEVGIVSCVEKPDVLNHPDEVVAEWIRYDPASLEETANILNTYDVAVIQHEFGIFGGADGQDVLALVDRLTVPFILVLHTVLPNPLPNQRRILEELSRKAALLVAQSSVARDRLLEVHDVAPEHVVVIQHGAPANLGPQKPPSATRRPVILTWGLIGPGKGIEHAIDAVAQLADLDPLPQYVIMGQTHPKVVEHSGEAYRESLFVRVDALGADKLVMFKDGYRDTEGILAEVQQADIILLPYLSREQVVSGVLVEAIASGKPVVSTAFPHAVELLAEGSGIVVPHEDPDALAAGLRLLLTNPDAAQAAAETARRQAPTLFWENVGAEYAQVALQVVAPKLGASL